MQTKGIIDGNYKALITLSSDSSDFSVIQDDACIEPQVDQDVISGLTHPVIPTHICDQAIANSNSVISSSFSSKLYGKIMAMKSFFMDELHTIKNESLTLTKSGMLLLTLIMVQYIIHKSKLSFWKLKINY